MSDESKPAPRNLTEVTNFLQRRGIRSAIIFSQVEDYLEQRGLLVTEVGSVKLRPGSRIADERDVAEALDALCCSNPAIAGFIAQAKADKAIRDREASVHEDARRRGRRMMGLPE